MGCPLPGKPINRNCPIVPCLVATALDMPIMCLPLTEGEVARPPFYLSTILLVDMLHSYCTMAPLLHFTVSVDANVLSAWWCSPALKLSFVACWTSLSGCPLNAQSIKKKHSEEEMMTIKLKASSGKLIWHKRSIKRTNAICWNVINQIMSFNPGVENKDDIQHLDHEINELNESNMKIEADMMQLQTQVRIYSNEFISDSKRFWAPARLIWWVPFRFVPESRSRLWNVTWRQLKRKTRWSSSTTTAFWRSSPALAKLSLAV